jgi:hypothetical protein
MYARTNGRIVITHMRELSFQKSWLQICVSLIRKVGLEILYFVVIIRIINFSKMVLEAPTDTMMPA